MIREMIKGGNVERHLYIHNNECIGRGLGEVRVPLCLALDLEVVQKLVEVCQHSGAVYT